MPWYQSGSSGLCFFLVHWNQNQLQMTRAGILVQIIHGVTFKIDAAEWVEISTLGRALPGVVFSIPEAGRALTHSQGLCSARGL